MAILFKNDFEGGWVALWYITETKERLLSLVSEDDRASCEGIANEARVMQRLAWRAIIRELLPDAGNVTYNDAGAPVLAAGKGYIGVSHCDKCAAVIYSRKPCAVDIENFGRNFNGVAPRCISEDEMSLEASGDPRFEIAMWCAKEALYKFSGIKGLNFLKDIRILRAKFTVPVFPPDVRIHTPMRLPIGCMTGWVKDMKPVALDVMVLGETCVVYINDR